MTKDFGRFGIAIVGAATAGCLHANRLSAAPATKVAVIDARGEDDYLWIPVPVGSCFRAGKRALMGASRPRAKLG
jgi:choline dehydrogenase